ncbi:hypothetical protein MASSI9I_90411 [Massilia sp. 9I]|nr:hypothetical protein MASSI9I_90411 [Massilia sp. 9I]
MFESFAEKHWPLAAFLVVTMTIVYIRSRVWRYVANQSLTYRIGAPHHSKQSTTRPA